MGDRLLVGGLKAGDTPDTPSPTMLTIDAAGSQKPVPLNPQSPYLRRSPAGTRSPPTAPGSSRSAGRTAARTRTSRWTTWSGHCRRRRRAAAELLRVRRLRAPVTWSTRSSLLRRCRWWAAGAAPRPASTRRSGPSPTASGPVRSPPAPHWRAPPPSSSGRAEPPVTATAFSSPAPPCTWTRGSTRPPRCGGRPESTPAGTASTCPAPAPTARRSLAQCSPADGSCLVAGPGGRPARAVGPARDTATAQAGLPAIGVGDQDVIPRPMSAGPHSLVVSPSAQTERGPQQHGRGLGHVGRTHRPARRGRSGRRPPLRRDATDRRCRSEPLRRPLAGVGTGQTAGTSAGRPNVSNKRRSK